MVHLDGMLPIRKTSPVRVGLSSYTGKLSVFRAPKKADQELSPVFKKLNRASIGEEPSIPKVVSANVFDNKFPAPYIFGALGERYKGFMVQHPVHKTLSFDFGLREQLKMDGGWVVCGSTTAGKQIVVNTSNEFAVVTNGEMLPLGDIYDVLEIERQNVPVEPAMLKVVGQTIPVGLVLARAVGFRGLLKMLKCKYRVEEAKTRKNLESHEYELKFKDKRFILDRRDRQAALIFGGLALFDKQIKNYYAEVFDRKEVYDHLLETQGCTPSVAKELDHLETSYVDPITKRTLEAMKEPQTFLGLMVRSAQLLMDYNHPDAQDMEVQQIRGYERFAGAIHKQLYKAIREFKNKNISGRSRIEMSPFAVWSAIREDPAKKTCEDINPIQNLKMHESVTFVGEGGRSKDAFMKDDRAFNVNDAGVISEASVDSGDVGINIYLSSNPVLKDVSGMKKKGPPEPNAGHYYTSSVMLSPASFQDDPKRTNFRSIQDSHSIQCAGYMQSYVQTGYEAIVPQRVDKLFCFSARQNGEVIGLTDKAIRVRYEDGSEDSCAIGRQYGSAEGSTYPNDIVPMVTMGQKFEKGDTICYNTGFFEVDFLNSKRVVLKMSLPVETAYMEDPRTHEDSCSISKSMSKRMETKTTKVKSYVVKFGQALHNVQKPGTKLEPEDVLMTIEDEISVGIGNFDAESAASLTRMGRQSPRSDYTGTLDRIEVFYHGDKGDMHKSLRALADQNDRRLAEQEKDLGRQPVNGRVDGDFSVKGKSLQIDHAEIKFYITVDFDMSPGDKLVFGHQLKSTVGEEMDFEMVTESGRTVDAMFGGRSALKRIVNSYALIGTATGNLQEAATIAVKMYRGEMK